jgi:hypothetical protein
VQTLDLGVTGPHYDSQWAPNDFADSQVVSLNLAAGVNDVRLEVVSEGYTINALRFAGASQPPPAAPPVVANQPPTVVTAANISSGPVTGTSAGLAVLGADDAGEAGLTYTWSVAGTPPAPVAFTVNGSNAAKTTTVSFRQAGVYNLRVTIRDEAGLTATSSVSVNVTPTLSAMTLTPDTTSLNAGGIVQFTAAGFDQFGIVTPVNPVWSVAGTGAAGSITPTGLYTASAVGGSTDTIKATAGSVSATASITVAAAPTVSTGFSYVKGFTTIGLATNGYAAVREGRLQLTNGGYQRGSAFFKTPVGIGRFSTSFNFQANNGSGDGIAFVLQGKDPTALGSGGGGLGYAGIENSLAVLFDTNGDAGVGKNMIGFAINGGTPVGGSLDLTAAGIDLRSGHEMRVVIGYDAGVLTVSIADVVTGKAAQLQTKIDVPSIIGGPAAYAGFTAATGGLASTQEVLNWTFTTLQDGQRFPRMALTRR